MKSRSVLARQRYQFAHHDRSYVIVGWAEALAHIVETSSGFINDFGMAVYDDAWRRAVEAQPGADLGFHHYDRQGRAYTVTLLRTLAHPKPQHR